MDVFNYSFTVNAPVQAVAEFHRSTLALRYLTPPPVIVQLHQVEPLAEGSRSIFTLWFGPFPIRWVAVHSQVDQLHSFTDTQESGPMRFWAHTHRFVEAGPNLTRVTEHIEYQHQAGAAGLVSRVLFSPLALTLMFAYRRSATRRRVRQPLHPS